MMGLVRRQSIQRKLIVLAAVSACVAVSLAWIGIVQQNRGLLRSAQCRQLQLQAEMLVRHSSPAVAAGDRTEAERILSALSADPSIEGAGFYDRHGQLLATFHQAGARAVPSRVSEGNESRLDFSDNQVELFHPVTHGQSVVGTLYLQAHQDQVISAGVRSALAGGAIMLAAWAAAVGVSCVWQWSISRPLIALATQARGAASEGDAGLPELDTGDETERLASALHRLQDQLRIARCEGQQIRDQLDLLVVERTAPLMEELRRREKLQAELIRVKDAAEAANYAKSEFLANMSHEIRTPLNAILGFTDLLRRSDDEGTDEERRDYLETVHRSGSQLLSMINDILDLSKIEAGQMQMELVRCSPHQIIADAVSTLRARALEKGLALKYHWTSPIPSSVLTDPARLRQLLINLVGNAIKYTQRGSIDLFVRLEMEGGDPQLFIDVVDTGVGIPSKKNSTRSFRRFRMSSVPAHAAAAGRDWGWPSAGTSPKLSGERFTWRARWAREAGLHCRSPRDLWMGCDC